MFLKYKEWQIGEFIPYVKGVVNIQLQLIIAM